MQNPTRKTLQKPVAMVDVAELNISWTPGTGNHSPSTALDPLYRNVVLVARRPYSQANKSSYSASRLVTQTVTTAHMHTNAASIITVQVFLFRLFKQTHLGRVLNTTNYKTSIKSLPWPHHSRIFPSPPLHNLNPLYSNKQTNPNAINK